MLFFGPIPQELHPHLALLEPFEVFSDFFKGEFGFVCGLGNLFVFPPDNPLPEFLDRFLAGSFIHIDLLHSLFILSASIIYMKYYFHNIIMIFSTFILYLNIFFMISLAPICEYSIISLPTTHAPNNGL